MALLQLCFFLSIIAVQPSFVYTTSCQSFSVWIELHNNFFSTQHVAEEHTGFVCRKIPYLQTLLAVLNEAIELQKVSILSLSSSAHILPALLNYLYQIPEKKRDVKQATKISTCPYFSLFSSSLVKYYVFALFIFHYITIKCVENVRGHKWYSEKCGLW